MNAEIIIANINIKLAEISKSVFEFCRKVDFSIQREGRKWN